MSNSCSVDHPVFKTATALGTAGAASALSAAGSTAPTTILFGIPVATMADLAALFAAIYTACLMFEFAWRKFIRPFLEDRKWIKRIYRRASDQAFHDKYER